ncbi:AAA family ATPase [Streptosporangium lutulentum]
MLYGRAGEQADIERLLAEARTGQSGALVIRGQAGIGKSALLDYAAGRAEGMRVLRGVGIESEAELPFAALHLLLRTGLDRIHALPDAQATALNGALGLGDIAPENRLLVGLAALSLLSELAGDGALLCLIDDAQWFDQASVDALVFAARRLEAEGVAMIFAARTGFLPLGCPSSGWAGWTVQPPPPCSPPTFYRRCESASSRSRTATPWRSSNCPPRSPPNSGRDDCHRWVRCPSPIESRRRSKHR